MNSRLPKRGLDISRIMAVNGGLCYAYKLQRRSVEIVARFVGNLTGTKCRMPGLRSCCFGLWWYCARPIPLGRSGRGHAMVGPTESLPRFSPNRPLPLIQSNVLQKLFTNLLLISNKQNRNSDFHKDNFPSWSPVYRPQVFISLFGSEVTEGPGKSLLSQFPLGWKLSSAR